MAKVAIYRALTAPQDRGTISLSPRVSETGWCGSVASFPVPSDVNPYQKLFYAGLRKHGFRVIWLESLNVRLIDLRTVTAVHFHWIEKVWGRKVEAPIHLRIRRFLRVMRLLRYAGCNGIARVWTVHNVEPHEQADWFDHIAMRVAGLCFDSLICHDRSAASQVQQRIHPRGKIFVMPHGNYEGVYPAPRPRAEVMLSLGLDPAKPSVCCVGQMREYKGIDIAVEAAHLLRGTVQLIIAGDARADRFDVESLRHRCRSAAYIAVLVKYLTDQEYADIVGASEAALLPYRKITGSGALLAVHTIGRGAVVSDLPYFRSVCCSEPDSFRVFQRESAAALASSIVEYLRIPSARREAAALRLARRYSWDRSVSFVLRAFRPTIGSASAI